MSTYVNEYTIKPPNITVGTESITKYVSQGSALSQAINWFYETFIGDGSLWDDLVKPLTGDFNRIKANADAWEQTGESFWHLGSNIEKNARTLTINHWDGDAGLAFEGMVAGAWLPGMLMAGEVCKFVGKGFAKIAEISIKAGRKAVQIVQDIIGLIEDLAMKLMPGKNLISMLWDAVVHGEFPFRDIVNPIEALIDTVKNLRKAIEAVCELAKGYLEGAKAVVRIIAKIPNLATSPESTSLAAGREMIQDIKTGVAAYEDYAGKPRMDEDGEVIRDDDGNVVRKSSKHDRTLGKLGKNMDEMDKTMKDAFGKAKDTVRKHGRKW